MPILSNQFYKSESAHRQRRLGFSREERLAAIRAIAPESLACPRRRAQQVLDLLVQIELRTGAEGCHCYVETLAAVTAGGLSRATFFRVRSTAEALGLLAVDHRYNGCGQLSNSWRVDWDFVGALAAKRGFVASPPPPPAGKAGQSGESLRESQKHETPPVHFETPRYSSALRTNTTMVDRVRAREGRSEVPGPEPPWPPAVIDRVRRLCREASRKLGARCREAGDRSLLAKAAYLALVEFGEAWLWGAIEGVRLMRPRRPWAYLHRTLANATAELGASLNERLAAVRVPAELLAGTPNVEDMRERLCAAGGDA